MSAEPEDSASAKEDKIFSVGYRKLPPMARRRWAPWPIARTALDLALRKRSTKVAAGFCAMVFFTTAIVLISQVIIGRVTEFMGKGAGAKQMAEVAARAVVGDTHEALSTFIGTQLFLTAILLGIGVGGIIADDRRTGAFELYFSRPLSKLHYAEGKLLAAALVPVCTIVLPFLALWIAIVGIAPGVVGVELAGLVVPGLVTSLLATLLLATTIVGVSSIGERGRTVGILYVTLFVVLAAMGGGLAEAGYPAAGYLAPQRDLQTVADELLGVGGISMTAQYLDIRHPNNDSALLSALALLAYSAAGLGLFAARLRKQVVG